MLALLAAAVVAAGAAPPQAERTARWTPNAYSVPEHCRDRSRAVVDRYGQPLLQPLGKLPGYSAILLVDRRIDGCRVVTVMKGLPPQPDNPNPPPSAYRFLPLEPPSQ